MTKLIVPIDLKALCVGQADNVVARNMAGNTVDFSRLPTSTNSAPYVSSFDSILNSTIDPAQLALEEGVHVHWSLPRALTKGVTSEENNIVFPAVPNRWILTRVEIPSLRQRSWVIDSDFIASTDELSKVTVVVNDDNIPFRYIGSALPIENWTDSPAQETLKQLTGSDLTAVGHGDPMFAAYYPNCKNVFGFHDALDGVAAGELLYMVSGYYVDPSNDPLNGGLSAETILTDFGWKAQPGTFYSSSLYNGMVQGVNWDPHHEYLQDDTSVNLDLALGNNLSESLAAWIAKDLPEGDARNILESLITGLQLGLLNKLNTANLDRLPQMRDAIHQAGFGPTDGGIMWSIVKRDKEDVAAAELPSNLSALLSQLNVNQAEYDRLVKKHDATRSQMFLDWFRHCLLDPNATHVPDPQDVGNFMEGVANFFPDSYFSHDLSVKEQTLSTSKNSLIQALTNTVWTLEEQAAPRYWAPMEPVVVLSGTEVQHRNWNRTSEIRVRDISDIITRLSLSSSLVTAPVFSSNQTVPNQNLHLSLLAEACLLDLTWLNAQTNVTLSQADLNQLCLQGSSTTTITLWHSNTPPDPLGFQWFSQDPWFPLILEWQMNLHANQEVTGAENFHVGLVEDNYHFDANIGDMVPTGSPQTVTDPLVYTGFSLLSPLVLNSLETAIQNLKSGDLADNIANALTSALDQMRNTPMAFQGLSGLNAALLTLEQTPQLPVGAPNSLYPDLDTGIIANLSSGISHHNLHGAATEGNFAPLRMGHAVLELSLIDVFGKRKRVPINSSNFHRAASLRAAPNDSSLVPGQVFLPPRISQPTRLLFRFLGANSDTEEMNALNSPVCGWIVPNHLDNSLMIYNGAHEPMGALNQNAAQVEWMPAPGSNLSSDAGTAFGDNSPLSQCVLGLIQNGGTFFASFMTYLLETLAGITLGPDSPRSLSLLLGRPLALLQTSLSLELMGRPAVNQTWPAFQAEIAAIDGSSADNFLQNRVSNGFCDVTLPVILGDPTRSRSGMIGYFRTSGNAYNTSIFYGISNSDDSNITPNQPLSLPIGGAPQRLLVLADPRTPLYVSSGFLPVKEIEIPSYIYSKMLRDMQVNFPISAVLGNQHFTLPLPNESGFHWAWVWRDGDQFLEVAVDENPEKGSLLFANQKIESGWLRLKKS